MKTLYFITTNRNKFEEAREILQPLVVEQIPMEIPELQGTPAFIVQEKVLAACNKLQKPCFVEDVALCCNAWQGLPGPYIKDFEQRIHAEGIWRMLKDFEDKTCKAVALIGYCEPGNEPRIFEGTMEGEIVEPRGTEGFGFDPVFLPKGFQQTYAEMGVQEKNKISHRKKALEQFKEWLQHEHATA